MHNDEPALLDALERGPLIEEVGEAIARCKPPQVFGVHGDWGLGKTSFLHQVSGISPATARSSPKSVTKDLERRAKDAKEDAPTQRSGQHRRVVQAVWFDAWRYQNEPAPLVALLHEMRAQLAWGRRAVRSTGRNAKVAVRGALLSMEELTKKIGFQYSKFHQASREWESENLAATLPSHTLREQLREAVRQLLPGKRAGEAPPQVGGLHRRCRSMRAGAAYRLLEGLKIYLTLDNCVFVLGMNQKAIEEAIAQRMSASSGTSNWAGRLSRSIGDAIAQQMSESSDTRPREATQGDGESAMRAAAYMEKLCQNVWRLPAVREPEQMLCRLLEKTIEDGFVRELVGRGLKIPRPRREGGGIDISMSAAQPEATQGPRKLDQEAVATIAESGGRAE